jgi:methylglutaconyl-CoA hydratase
MSDAPVLVSVDARGVGTITLNRPAVNNAYDASVVTGMVDAVTQVANDPQVRIVVLRGNGRHFQAGADLSWLMGVASQSPDENLAVSRLTGEAMRALNQLDKPTIALVHGACIGGGTGIISSCDVVIAEASAVFAISEARWGMAATIIFPQLIAAIGERQCRRYALTCEKFDAERARELGLVHEVCADGELDYAAEPVINGLLDAGPDAVRITKQGLLRSAGSYMDDGTFAVLAQEHALKRQSAEAAEGFASFKEKRRASWYPNGA